MINNNGQSYDEGIHNRSRRQELIAEYILKHSTANVQELAEMFKVSAMTIHRDLDELERQGILRKVRGGATAQPSSLFESDMRYRIGSSPEEKLAIARYALQLIEPGQAIMLDDSTTTLTLAGLLSYVTPLTVVTNSLSIIQQITPIKGIRLISLGGEYSSRYSAFTGIICERAISSLRVNILFMSTSAVMENIAYHQEQDAVKVKRAMMESAAKRILLIDNNKFQKMALYRLTSLDQFDMVIVDARIQSDCLSHLRESGIRVEVADL